MSKREQIFALAAHNAKTGEAVHCWCEGGDATDDMFEVPADKAEEVQRMVDKRMREIEETRARMLERAQALG